MEGFEKYLFEEIGYRDDLDGLWFQGDSVALYQFCLLPLRLRGFSELYDIGEIAFVASLSFSASLFCATAITRRIGSAEMALDGVVYVLDGLGAASEFRT